jgi:type I restriction enzyme S subunit
MLTKLLDVIESISDTYQFESPEEQVVFLNTSDIYDGKIVNRITEKAKNLPGQAKKKIQKGDILYSEIRPANKRYAYVDENAENYVVSTKLMVLRVKHSYSTKYIYQFLKAQTTLDYLQMQAESRSGTFPQITYDVIAMMQIDIPPIDTQKEIAHILGTLDDKIELNRRMNKTLEEIAQALFKHWFIDFEFPNAEGKPYKSSGGAMIDSELGPIPQGWKVGKLSDEFDITMGQSPPGDTYNTIGEGLPFYQGNADFDFRFPKNRVYCTMPKRLAHDGDTLISVRAPVGDINMSKGECCIGRGLSAVRHKSKSKSYTFYAMLTLNDRFNEFDKEGTVFGCINKEDFNSILWIGALNDIVTLFNGYINFVDGRIENNTTNIYKLEDIKELLIYLLVA